MAARSESKNTLTTAKALNLITATTYGVAGDDILTAAEVLTGLYLRDASSSGRTDTLPTPTALAAAIPGVQIGTTIRWHVRNTGNDTLTIAADAAGSDSGTMTIAQYNSKEFLIVFTAVGTPDYTIYSTGTRVSTS